MVTIRVAERVDCPLIHDLQIEAFKSLLQTYQDFETNPGNETLERIYSKFDQPETTYFMIDYEHNPVGAMRVVNHADKNVCRVSPVFILPEFHGRGIAQQVFKLVEAHYNPHVKWILDTILEEEGNCYLYEKLGYKKTGKLNKINERMTIVYYEKEPIHNPIELVIFDMGNTLLNFHAGQTDDEKDAIGLHRMQHYLESHYDSSISLETLTNDFYKPWLADFHLRETGIELDVYSYMRKALVSEALMLSDQELLNLMKVFYSPYKESVVIAPWVLPVLQMLKKQGIHMAIASNCILPDEIYIEIFEHLGLASYIDKFVFSYSRCIRKPDHRLFNEILTFFNTKPQRALMVGDSLKADIKPADSLGLKTIWYKMKQTAHIQEDEMNRGERYDAMIANKENDELGCFEQYEAIMSVAQNRIRVMNPMRLYDLGCGTGNLCGPLSEQMNVMGVDFSMEMLMQASMKYPNVYSACYGIEDFMEELTVKPRDLFASAFVLHTIPDKTKLWACLSKAMAAGASLMLIDYFFESESHQNEAIKQHRLNGREDLAAFLESKHYVTLEALSSWVSELGCKLEFKWMTSWIGMAVITKLI